MNKLSLKEELSNHKVMGVITFTVRDRQGKIVRRWSEHNIVKIFAKEMLAHRIPSTQVWDINANSGSGGWVDTNNDPHQEFSARYILFGASFDPNGVPLDVNDPRYYTTDPVTGQMVPIALGPGADYDGGLINAIPLAEPQRPLKRVENITYSPTYQPAGTPLLQPDVRAINNVVNLTTTLELFEYNGLGISDSDYFTITEVALVGGRLIGAIGACEISPRDLFLQGAEECSIGSAPFTASAGPGDVITLSPAYANEINQGDQIKIVGSTDSAGADSIPQVSPFYLVLSKLGSSLQLDRVPVTTSNVPITGPIGVYRDTLRIFSQRILNSPLKKSADFEIEVTWSLIFN